MSECLGYLSCPIVGSRGILKPLSKFVVIGVKFVYQMAWAPEKRVLFITSDLYVYIYIPDSPYCHYLLLDFSQVFIKRRAKRNIKMHRRLFLVVTYKCQFSSEKTKASLRLGKLVKLDVWCRDITLKVKGRVNACALQILQFCICTTHRWCQFFIVSTTCHEDIKQWKL